MVKADPKASCCAPGNRTPGGCHIESLVSVDERGQMVLPKDLRDKAGIKAGDKMALVSLKRDGEICCLALIKVDQLADQVKEFLGPVLRNAVAG